MLKFIKQNIFNIIILFLLFIIFIILINLNTNIEDNYNDINDIEDEDIIDGSDEEGVDIIHLDKSETSIVISIFNCKSSEKNNYSSKSWIIFFLMHQIFSKLRVI